MLRNLLLESLKFADWQLDFKTDAVSSTASVVSQIDKPVLH